MKVRIYDSRLSSHLDFPYQKRQHPGNVLIKFSRGHKKSFSTNYSVVTQSEWRNI